MSKPTNTRARILEAAEELFYNEGLRAANIERIAARAHITKKTLYYYFRSKDDLMAECLHRLDRAVRTRYQDWVEAGEGTFTERFCKAIAALAQEGSAPHWKGCAFSRAVAELAGLPGHPARKAASAHKKQFEAWLREQLLRAGLEHPDMRARQLMILIDGLIVQMLLHHDVAYAAAAQSIAQSILVAPPERRVVHVRDNVRQQVTRPCPAPDLADASVHFESPRQERRCPA